MKINKTYLTANNCYIKGSRLDPKGVMIHSTACKGVPASNFIKSWNTARPNDRDVCVHGFIDLTGVYETLPLNMRGWHAGGTANNELLGFEVCEPKDYADVEYFNKIRDIVVEYVAHLCTMYGWGVGNITSHCEANKRRGDSYASNHADLDHWWLKYHNYSMDDFRADVLVKMEDYIMYHNINEVPDWGKATITKLMDKGYLKGDEYGDLKLTETMLRILVINDRAGLYN